ncbi:SCO family protein [Schlesneria paludicola]|uniref:SCO family protein n=1 Tax=Schlesneria paludicola TaxID=360056 RepID=UPI00029B48BB|nr:SCO family protein [Schlesneria paludicola]
MTTVDRPTLTACAIVSLRLVLAMIMSLLIDSTAFAQRFTTGSPYRTPAGQSPTAELLRDIGIEQQLDSQLPLDAVFHDEMGRRVPLGEFFDHRPVVIALVQYRCPMLCSQVLNGFLKTSQAVPLEIGRDYQFIAISFDARESSDLAAEKKKQYSRAYRRSGAANGMHFLTGDQDAIDRITRVIGFRYRYVERTDQFAHASGLMIATPKGRLSRYMYGIDFAPQDLRWGLEESAIQRIGSRVDQILLLCYHYDPLTGKYGLAISNLLRIAGGLTIFGLGTYLAFMFRNERRRSKLFPAENRAILPMGASDSTLKELSQS